MLLIDTRSLSPCSPSGDEPACGVNRRGSFEVPLADDHRAADGDDEHDGGPHILGDSWQVPTRDNVCQRIRQRSPVVTRGSVSIFAQTAEHTGSKGTVCFA